MFRARPDTGLYHPCRTSTTSRHQPENAIYPRPQVLRRIEEPEFTRRYGRTRAAFPSRKTSVELDTSNVGTHTSRPRTSKFAWNHLPSLPICHPLAGIGLPGLPALGAVARDTTLSLMKGERRTATLGKTCQGSQTHRDVLTRLRASTSKIPSPPSLDVLSRSHSDSLQERNFWMRSSSHEGPLTGLQSGQGVGGCREMLLALLLLGISSTLLEPKRVQIEQVKGEGPCDCFIVRTATRKMKTSQRANKL
jgi:hypothetical protein